MEYFTYLPEFKLLACNSCKTALIFSRIEFHLRQPPHIATKVAIQAAIQWATTLDLLKDNPDLQALSYPPPYSPAIVALGPPLENGFCCTMVPDCNYIGTSLRRIREHLKSKHQWLHPTKPGRRSKALEDPRALEGPWRYPVSYQRFFQRGPYSNYFEVALGDTLRPIRGPNAEPTLEDAISSFQAKANTLRLQDSQPFKEPDDFLAPNPWLRRLGSATHLQGFQDQKPFLRGLISLEYSINPQEPDANLDRQLRIIHIAFDLLLIKAIKAVTPENISWNALFELNRRELNKERNRPFHYRHKPKTRAQYSSVIKSLLSYIVRAVDFNDPKDRPPFTLTSRQDQCYEALMALADTLVARWDSGFNNPQHPDFQASLEAIGEATLELFIAILDHYTKNSEYDSILISFLTILSLRADGTWESYLGFTPKLSAILAISRLLTGYKAI